MKGKPKPEATSTKATKTTKTTKTSKADAVEPWFVYVLRCADRTLYTGIAKDVARRVREHDEGKGARYTRGRGPVEVLATARCHGQGEALRVELALKALTKPQKLRLVSTRSTLGAFVRRMRRESVLR